MPIMNNGYQQYKKTQVDTASQGKLIVMLYDGAIRFVNIAIEAMPTKNIEKIHNNILKAQEIINELISSLNMDVGDISQKLFSLYMYMNKRLMDANIQKDAAPLVEVRKYLMELRDAWQIEGNNVGNDPNHHFPGVNIAT